MELFFSSRGKGMTVYAKIELFLEVIEKGILVKVIHYFAHNDR